MNITQLKTAAEIASFYGVKSVIYGPPGTGKTPMIATAPRPVLCATEPGLLSLRFATNVPVWQAYTPGLVDEFMLWATTSAEAKAFDTLCFDSGSQMAEAKLEVEERGNKHGLKAYGEMAKWVMKHMTSLYFLPYKHIVILCKQEQAEVESVMKYRPYFPGKELHVRVPHLFDQVLRIDWMQAQAGQRVRAIYTEGSINFVARDRIGKLAAVEPADLGHIITKCMS